MSNSDQRDRGRRTVDCGGATGRIARSLERAGGPALAAAGGAPFHMIAMSWSTPDPAAFDPSRHDLDLTYREVFGGFRPPIAVERSPSGPFVIRARAQIPQSSSAEPVWHGLSGAELARDYSPRGQVADMSALFARWTADGAVFRRGRRDLDIAYGSSAFETLDVYRPDRAVTVPSWVFIHGGYWQASDKDQHAQFAAGMLERGICGRQRELRPLPRCSAGADHGTGPLRIMVPGRECRPVRRGRGFHAHRRPLRGRPPRRHDRRRIPLRRRCDRRCCCPGCSI